MNEMAMAGTVHSGPREVSGSRTQRTSGRRVPSGEKEAFQAEPKGSASQTEAVRYDVSSGAGRVAGLMNHSEYYADQMAMAGDAAVAYAGGAAGGKAAAAYGNAAYSSTVKTGFYGAVSSEEALDALTGKRTSEDEEDKKKKDLEDSQKELDFLKEMLKQIQENRENQKKVKVKKKVNYSYQRVSSGISRAKNTQQAGNALGSAQSALSDLKRKLASKQYDEKELEIAINHAYKMIRAAEKKMTHLKQEGQLEKNDKDIAANKEQDNKKIRLRVKPKLKKPSEKVQLDVKLKQELDSLKERLKQLTKADKNANRRAEDLELLQADMEYLKKKIDLMQQELTSDGSNGQLSGTEGVGAVFDAASGAAVGTAAVGDTKIAVAADNAGQLQATAQAQQAVSAVSNGGGFDVSV